MSLVLTPHLVSRIVNSHRLTPNSHVIFQEGAQTLWAQGHRTPSISHCVDAQIPNVQHAAFVRVFQTDFSVFHTRDPPELDA